MKIKEKLKELYKRAQESTTQEQIDEINWEKAQLLGLGIDEDTGEFFTKEVYTDYTKEATLRWISEDINA